MLNFFDVKLFLFFALCFRFWVSGGGSILFIIIMMITQYYDYIPYYLLCIIVIVFCCLYGPVLRAMLIGSRKSMNLTWFYYNSYRTFCCCLQIDGARIVWHLFFAFRFFIVFKTNTYISVYLYICWSIFQLLFSTPWTAVFVIGPARVNSYSCIRIYRMLMLLICILFMI